MATIIILLAIPTAKAPSLGFHGQYRQEYALNMAETNEVTVSFRNTVNIGNATLQYKILPTQDNDLYNEPEGKQNGSWRVFVNIYDPSQRVLLVQELRNGALSTPVPTEKGGIYTAEMLLILDKSIKNGTYSIRFAIIINEFENENQTIQSLSGAGGGAKLTPSIATQQYLTVTNIKSEADYSAIISGIGLVLCLSMLGAMLRRRAKRRALNEH